MGSGARARGRAGARARGPAPALTGKRVPLFGHEAQQRVRRCAHGDRALRGVEHALDRRHVLELHADLHELRLRRLVAELEPRVGHGLEAGERVCVHGNEKSTSFLPALLLRRARG